jgi:GAF domain-containing protein
VTDQLSELSATEDMTRCATGPRRRADQRTDDATALTFASRLLHGLGSADETFAAAVQTARTTIPGVDGAGICLPVQGRLETRAATDPVAEALTCAQDRAGEGPCLDVLATHALVIAEDLQTETRWPAYVEQARAAGIAAQLAIHLHDEERTLGVLNLYSTRPGTVGAATVRVARLYAVHAGLALLEAQHRQQMHDALESRKLIGQATGLVMERYKIDEQRAFEFLVRTSQTTNVKIRDVARQMVHEASGRAACEAS